MYCVWSLLAPSPKGQFLESKLVNKLLEVPEKEKIM